MSVSAETSRTRDMFEQPRHTLNDWLSLHDLTQKQCSEVLSRAQNYASTRFSQSDCGISASRAWEYAATALEAAFPEMTDVIRRTRDTAALNLDAHGTPPLTAPTGSGTTVFMHYRGRIGDMLTLAHEFGHALQITQTGGTFVSPIAREICAFLAELALLAKLARDDPALGAMALDAWHVDNGSYLGKHAAALDRALTDPGSQYVYGWNYPIARVLASEAAGQLPVETRWSVFENRVSVSGLATFLGCFRRASPTCTGACLNYSGKLKHTE